jgi:release factor glutamine methyltransferase
MKMTAEEKEWTICSVLDWTSDYFTRKGLPDGRVEAEVLLSHVLQCPRLELHLKKDDRVPVKQLAQYSRLIIERRNRKPAAYITGEKEFMGLSFKVNEHTLIPRPETELLVEKAISTLKGKKKAVVADICSGSGNIAVSIAKFADVDRVYASDVSESALVTAQDNVFRHGLAAKVILKRGNLFAALEGEHLENGIDLIVSNPPYVALEESGQLAPELKYEPRIALFGGNDGLEFYGRIAADAKKYLKPKGTLIIELNAQRSPAIREIFEKAGYRIEAVSKDYAGFDRIMTLRINNG